MRDDEAAAAERRERAVECYRRYGPAVYRHCLQLLREREAAREATQVVFVKLLRNGKVLDPSTALPLIFRVATRHCMNVLKVERRRKANAAKKGFWPRK